MAQWRVLVLGALNAEPRSTALEAQHPTATAAPWIYSILVVEEETPEPINDRCSGLAEFEALTAQNWDGEGAEPVSPDTLAAARRFLSALPPHSPDPEADPGADGSICFEWFFDGPPQIVIYTDFGPGNQIRALVRTDDQPASEGRFESVEEVVAFIASGLEAMRDPEAW